MKTGILTFHKQLNCGAALQTYAIKKAYEECGAEVQVIDFHTKQMADRCKIFFKGGIKARILNILLLFQYPKYVRNRNAFMRFAENYMNLTKHYGTYEELLAMEEKFDIISSGSDQILNGRKLTKDQLMAYCQEFHHNAKKVTYAASIGDGKIHNLDDLKGLCDFDHISLREDYHKNEIEELTGKSVEIVCDPTYLLHKEEYEKIARERLYKKPYILCYCLTNPKKMYDAAKELQSLTGLDVVVIARKIGIKIKADKVFWNADPQEFLSLVQNAEYVVTNSFHGTAFSVIYEKPFFSYVESKTKKTRIGERLEKFGLEDRIVYNDSPPITKEQLSVDFTEAKEVVEKERANAMAYIKRVIEQ